MIAAHGAVAVADTLDFMEFAENVPLAGYTTFGIGGPARWFAEAASEADILEGVAFAGERGLALFILGGGSNLLISDSGFAGLVLRIALLGVEESVEGNKLLLRAGAGENWDALISRAVSLNAGGMECLAGIPGTVGGTPVQNVGAYGQEVSGTVRTVRVLELATGAFRQMSAAECGFGYRQSVFNTTAKGKYIVTRVDYALTVGGPPTLAYADLKRHFQDWSRQPSLAEMAEAVRAIRRQKGMFLVEGDPDTASAGSFFKNPVVDPDGLRAIQAAVPAGTPIPQYPAAEGRVKIAAAWLLEQAGFTKGFGGGAAGISSRHTLALVNRGGAMAADIMELSAEIVAGVEKRFGVRLEREPVFLGLSNNCSLELQ